MDYTTKSCREFVTVLASNEPAPGGGGASALVAAVGTALGNMVGSLTVGKKKYADVEAEIVFIGDDGRRLLRLYSETRLLPPHEHSHLYFRLPEGCFQMAGDAEELRLFAAVGDVTGREKSKLIFLTD